METANKDAKRMELKLKLVEDPGSIVIVPHTEEGYALASLAVAVDRIVWLLRKKLGLTISPEEFESYTERLTKSLERMRSMIPQDTVADRFNVEDKLRLARLKRSIVFLPRTIEGRMMATFVKKIDPVIVQIKASEPADRLLEKISFLYNEVACLHSILSELSEKLQPVMTKYERHKVYYKPSKQVRKIIRTYGGNGEDSSESITATTD